MVEKNNKKLKVIVAILGVFLLLFGILVVIINSQKNNNVEITEEEVIKLIDYIPMNNSDVINIFGDRLITIEDLPQQIILNRAYTNLEITDMNGSIIDIETKEECEDMNNIWAFGFCYLEGDLNNTNYFFNKNKMINKLIDMYGNYADKIELQNVSDGESCNCNLLGENYYCYCNDKNFEKGYSRNLIIYDGYKQRGNELYLYVKYLYAVYEEDLESGDMKVSLYQSKGGPKVGYSYTFDREYNFKGNEDKALTYINIYKQNEEGIYHWYGIEPK